MCFSTCNKDTRSGAVLTIHFYSTLPIKTLVANSLYYDKGSIFRPTITFHIRCNFRTNFFYIICAVNLLSTIFTVHLRLPLCRFLIILPVLPSIFLVDLFLGFDFRLWIFLFDIHAG